MKLLFLLATIVVVALCAVDRTGAPTYNRMDNHKLVSVSISTQAQIDALQKLEEQRLVDIWSHSSAITFGKNELHVAPENMKFIEYLGVGYDILHENIQELFDEELSSYKYVPFNASADDWFTAYHRFTETLNRNRGLAGNYGPASLSFNLLGKTYEGRDLFAMKLSSGGSGKTTFFNTAGIHAREWISPQTLQYIMETFIEKLEQGSARELALINKMDFTFMPMSNPDGYEYSWTNTRLWRKSRAPTSNPSCPGTDLNRNFDSHWGEGGSSTNPCSDTYRGGRVESELETQIISKYFKDNQPTGFGIDWHAYSQLILRPWGWTNTLPPCNTKCQATGEKMRNAIRAVDGKAYTNQRSIQLYLTTGTASDFYYDSSTLPATESQGFTIELRPASAFPGFQLPASEILKTGEENYAGFLEAAESV